MQSKTYLMLSSLLIATGASAQYYKPAPSHPTQFLTSGSVAKLNEQAAPSNIPQGLPGTVVPMSAPVNGGSTLPITGNTPMVPANDIRIPAPPLQTAGDTVVSDEGEKKDKGGATQSLEKKETLVRSASSVGGSTSKTTPATNNIPIVNSIQDLKIVNPHWNSARAEYYEKKSAERLEKIALQATALMQTQYQPPANAHPNFRKDLAIYIQRARDFGIAPEKVELELRTRSPENFIAWVKRVTQ